MAISSTDVTAGPYTTNGATVDFSFSFRVADYGGTEAEDMVKVILVTISTGVETVLTRGVSAGQYTVSINGDQDSSPGGSITTISTYATGYYIYVRLKPTFTQATELTAQTGYNGATHEAQFDEQQRQILDLNDKVRRSVVAGVQIGESFSGEITGTPVAGYLPQLNDDLTGFEWVANNGSSNLVTATGSTTARTLADRFAELGLVPEDNSAGGAGATDDTAEVQGVIDAAIGADTSEGDPARLLAGSTYSATNLTLGTCETSAAGSGARNWLGAIGGMATIKARAGGDADYLIATDRWLDDNADKDDLGSPWLLENIVVDGNSIAERGVVNKAFLQRHVNCYFQGATVANVEFTRQNQDATDGAATYPTGDWIGCRWRSATATYHFRTLGLAGDAFDAPADGSVIFGEFGGAVDYDLDLANGAGWMTALTRFYGATVAGVNTRRMSRGYMHALCNMDSDGTAPAMIIGEVGGYKNAVIGPGSKWYADLRADFKADASAERIVVLADHFISQQNAATTAVAVHNNNNANKELVLLGCVSLADTPYERGVGNTAGIIKVFSSFCGDAYYGAIQDDPGATAGPIVRWDRRSASPAANDLIARHEYGGSNDAGARVCYAATEAIIGDAAAAGPDGSFRIKFLHEGNEVTGLTVGHGLTQSIAGGNAVGASFSGEGNTSANLTRYSADVTSPIVSLNKARGTIASPASVSQFDELGQVLFTGYGGGAFRAAAYLRAFVQAATPSGTDMETDVRAYAAAAGSVTPTEMLRLRHSTGLSMFGANPVIDANRLFQNRVYTVATLPSGAQGKQCYASDLRVFDGVGTQEGAGVGTGGVVQHNGTAWKIAGTNVTAVA